MGYRKKKKNGFFTRQGKRLEKAAEKFTAARERSAARSDRRQTATLSRLKAKAEREKLRADIRKERTRHRPKPSQRKKLTVGLNGSQTGSSLYSGAFGTGSASVGGFGRPLSKPKKRRTKKKKPAKRKKTTTKKRKKVYFEYR